MQPRRIVQPLVLLATLAVVAAACGGGGGGTKGALETVKARGRLLVGSDIAYAPVEFYKEGTKEPEGIDIDLCEAIAARMGLKDGCEFRNTAFDGIIPALKAKRFDIIMSAMSDTPEREAEIDFVDYFTAGTSILVRKGNPEGIHSLDDLCGKTIGVQKGTTQEEVAGKQKQKCKAKGSDLTVLTFDTDPEAQQALKAGRTVADMNDFPVAAYVAKTTGDFEVVGEQIGAGPYGIGVRKEDTDLRDAIQRALKAVIADGTYDRILEKWNVTRGALKTAAINGG
ncbi:MAG: atrA protein [Acidimicrobiia bacterium]